MSLKQLFTWFKDSQQSPRAREVRTLRAVRARAIKVDDELRTPHYYAFYYPEGRERPKLYVGPCTTKAETEAAINTSWPAKAGEPRSRFKLKQLTADQFKTIWGAWPGHTTEGY